MEKPPLTYVPALTTRGTVLAFGDNRMTDLASKRSDAVVGNDRLIPDTIHLKPFPFDKARCDGAGCVMKYSWPAMIGSVFFVSIHDIFNQGWLRERKRYQGGFVSVGYITNRVLDVLDDIEIH